jgi:hypothetical protein
MVVSEKAYSTGGKRSMDETHMKGRIIVWGGHHPDRHSPILLSGPNDRAVPSALTPTSVERMIWLGPLTGRRSTPLARQG